MKTIVLAFSLLFIPAAVIAEQPVPQQSRSCICHARGRVDYHGNYPTGRGYHNTVNGACNAAINACVSAAGGRSVYLPCVAVNWQCY